MRQIRTGKLLSPTPTCCGDEPCGDSAVHVLVVVEVSACRKFVEVSAVLVAGLEASWGI